MSYLQESLNTIVTDWKDVIESYDKYINEYKHTILRSGHPSPLNRSNPFLGNNHFVECNLKLIGIGSKEINW